MSSSSLQISVVPLSEPGVICWCVSLLGLHCWDHFQAISVSLDASKRLHCIVYVAPETKVPWCASITTHWMHLSKLQQTPCHTYLLLSGKLVDTFLLKPCGRMLVHSETGTPFPASFTSQKSMRACCPSNLHCTWVTWSNTSTEISYPYHHIGLIWWYARGAISICFHTCPRLQCHSSTCSTSYYTRSPPWGEVGFWLR